MAIENTGTLAYLNGEKDIQFKEYEVPTPERGAVVTRIKYANVCGSDLHTWAGKHPQRVTGMMGHEGVCEVAELGEGVETDYAEQPIAVGDLVAPVYFIPCLKCPPCQAGDIRLCNNLTEHTTGSPDDWPHFTGTFATHYYIHPTQYFYKVPSGLDPKVAASANCALSQVMWGLDQVGATHSDTVVIQGAGGLGLTALAVANESGAETIVIEGVEHRLRTAEEFHADHVVDFREYTTPDDREARIMELTDGVGADVVVEVAGVPAVFTEGLRFVRKGGTYLEIGNVNPGETTDIDPGSLTRNSIDIVTAHHYGPWYLLKALRFLDRTADTYPYGELVDKEFDLMDLTEALHSSEKRETTRATLSPHR